MDDETLLKKLEIQEKIFPNLKLEEFEITSPEDFKYNCFAWAAGYDDVIMQPSTNKIYCWLTGEIGETLDNFEKQFNLLWFKERTDAEYEEGFEKIALYVKDSEVTHASRQIETGWWATKLGQWGADIEHKVLDGLEGEEYGKVALILKRPLKYKEIIQQKKPKKEEVSQEFKNFTQMAKNLLNVPKKELKTRKTRGKGKSDYFPFPLRT